MQIFELYGLSGAGKSTMAESARKKLEADGYSVLMMNEVYYSKYNNIKTLIEAVRADFSFASACLSFIIDYGFNKNNLKCFMKITVMRFIAGLYGWEHDCLLIDEGIIQFSLVAGERALKNNKKTEKYIAELKKISEDYHYVYADISVDSSVKRVNERKRKIAVNSLDESQQRAVFEQTKKNFEVLLADTNASVSTVNTEESPEACADALYGIIKGVLEEDSNA